jgi:LmbE family N-acetylglucosaminyl deacetylase
MEAGAPIYPKWLFHYYATHLRIVPAPSFCIDISAQLERKIASIRAYRSQFEANEKNRQVIEWVRAQAVYFGSRIGTAAAEPFFAREPLGLAAWNLCEFSSRGSLQFCGDAALIRA